VPGRFSVGTILIHLPEVAPVLLFFALLLGDIPPVKAPANGKPLTFKIEMTLGDENQDHLTWGSEAMLALAQDGRMALLDHANHRLLLLAQDGSLLWQNAKQGQGPGEMVAPSALAIGGDRLAVFDTGRRRMMLFSLQDGSLEGEKALPEQVLAVIQPSLGAASVLMTVVAMNERFQQAYILRLYDGELNNPIDLGQVATPAVDWSAMGQPGFLVDYLAKQFGSVALGFPLGLSVADRFLAVNSAQYRGTFHDAAGQAKGSFAIQHAGAAFSEAHRRSYAESIADGIRRSAPFGQDLNEAVLEAALARGSFPEIAPPISALIGCDEGFAVLRHFDPSKRMGLLDLFDGQGRWLQSGAYLGPGGALVIRQGRLYDLGDDGTGVIRLVRSQIIR
jgi:hypothetical protein